MTVGQRKKPIARSPMKRGKRPAAETTRIYGPPARRAWVKSLPCFVCYQSPCDNAHTTGLGMGIKAGYETVIPLCRAHHRAYDEHRAPFDQKSRREMAKLYAATVEAQWQARSGGTEHISSIVARVMEEL